MLEVVAIPFGFAQGALPLRSLSEAEGKLILHKAGSIETNNPLLIKN
ncbi:MAG: hypothetical protein ABL933_08040 [Methyloglobulus sp.]|nr:hypothetical protein [Methyloglobulus sp.]